MGFEDQYYPFLLAADINGAWTFLQSLTDDERGDAKGWFERSRVTLLETVYSDTRSLTGSTDMRPTVVAPWILALGPIAFLGPVTAARKIPWTRMWSVWDDETIMSFVIERLCEKDRAWTAAFVEEASASRAGDSGHTVAWIVRAVATRHELPCPPGDTFLEHWTAGVPDMSRRDPTTREWKPDPVAWLSHDPFMPDLLFRYLASGHCGTSDWLPATLPELIDRKVIGRDEIVEHVLVQLTAQQRPASQKVLVRILEAVGLEAAEVQGGCAYFLGVIATSKGVVGKLMLPMALQTVAVPEDLAELVAVIAGRTEKAQKVVLLNALKEDELQQRVGVDAVRSALELLASDEDAAFAQKVRGVLDRLPGSSSELSLVRPGEPEPSGLWERPPTPSGAPDEGWFHARNPRWSNVLDSRAYAAEMRQSPLVDRVLEAMADGRFDAEAALKEISGVLGGGRLSASTTVSVFQDLFLSGGLRDGYAVLLAVTDGAASLTTKPAGLADMIRLLAEYAAEIPVAKRPSLPARLESLAAGKGRTKAQAEVRVLGARLTAQPLEAYVASLAAVPVDDPVPIRRGLWKPPDEESLAKIRLPEADAALARRLAEPVASWFAVYDAIGGFGLPAPTIEGYGPGVALSGPDLQLAATLRSIRAAGAGAFRAQLEPPPPDRQAWSVNPITLGVEMWAWGGLEPSRFWDLARRARTAMSVRREVEKDRSRWPQEEMQELYRSLHSGASALAFDGSGPFGERFGLVLAPALDEPVARLHFLRTLEALMLVETTPELLATPTWADGTMDLDDLLERLRAARGRPLGPLDVVQALHRLRPCDRGRVADIEELARSGGLWQTEPSLTSPDGADSWDVLDLCRSWIAAGGAPALDPSRGPDGGWVTEATMPVPWSSCAAAPAELRADPWSAGVNDALLGSVRTFPLWPDRAIPATGPHMGAPSLPIEMSGHFGPPLHEALLGLLLYGVTNKNAASLGAARRVLRRGKVEPELFARAVAITVDAGDLNARRLAQAIQALFEQDCLAQLWGAALAAADVLAASPDAASAGVGQLFDVLAAYVHEVPEPVVPEGLRSFASSGGRTKSYAAAARLVSALERGAGS